MASATGHCSAGSSRGRPRLEVADIFRSHGEDYRRTRPLSSEQRKTMWAIENCRTAALGGHLELCPDCGDVDQSYNSCHNRHCPKCQALAQARWIEARKARVLPIPHFHVVFTLPSELRALAAANRKEVFRLLFKAASETLHAFADDPKRLGAQLGITAVLHTWTRKLAFHPHLHCIVTGGGLSKDGCRWVQAKSSGKFLFPVEPLSMTFRGKFVAALDRSREQGRLRFVGTSAPLANKAAFKRLKSKLFACKWVVYAKRPFGGAEHVFEYLGRYTHRTGISNHRLVSMDERGVTFRTHGDSTETLPAPEFIRRFLMHVLPSGFVKIRHYGLLAPCNVNTRLAIARALLDRPGDDQPLAAQPKDPGPLDWGDLLLALTGIDPRLCPKCGAKRLRFPFVCAPALTRIPP